MSNSRAILGIILILFGGLYLIEQLGLLANLNFSVGKLLSTYWPVVLIVIGLVKFNTRNMQGPLFLIGLGVILLITTSFGLSFWSTFWPVIIISIGLFSLFPKSNYINSTKTTINTIDETIIFWGTEKRIKSDRFTGGSITAIFGGAEIDLSDVYLKSETETLDITCILGGVEVKVSGNYKTLVQGTGILGGFESNSLHPNIPVDKTLIIKGTAILGGVEVKS